MRRGTYFSFLIAIFSQLAIGSPTVLEPGTQHFINELTKKGGPPIYTLSPKQARAVLTKLQSGKIDKLPVDIHTQKIPIGAMGTVPITILRPKNSTERLPVVMYFHGGGWVMGSKDTHDRLLREIVNGAQVAVVFVEYSLSPEAKYPVAIEQAYGATKWIATHGQDLNLDPRRIAVAGDSVGGNMAAVVTMLAKEQNSPKIDFQLLFYPVTDGSLSSESYKQFAEGPWLTRQSMEWFWDAYAPKNVNRNDPKVSPIRATVKELANLPPALIITNQNDVLRDEGEAYAQQLAQAGVKVTAVRYLGTIHDFVMLNDLSQTPAARAAIEQATAALRNALWKP